MIVNLTPHPLPIYPSEAPDRIAAGSVTPLRVLPPSAQHQPAQLGHRVIGEEHIDEDVPIVPVAFSPCGSPGSDLPEPRPGTWYVVSLVVGLAAEHRDDLLVPHEYVRDLNGNIIGCRALARPKAITAATPVTPIDAVTVAIAPPRPATAKPWCNYAIHRTASPRRTAGSKVNKAPHGVSKRRWLRRNNDWRQQQQAPAA